MKRAGKGKGLQCRAALQQPPSGAASQDVDSLYRLYFQDLVANIRKSFGAGPPEAEDVVQSAFVKYANLKDKSAVKSPRSFLYIAARNFVLDYKRTSKVADAYLAEQIALDAEFKLEGLTPERVVESRERFDILVAAMRELPHKQQVILTMSRLEGKSYREIRKETGWSAGDISRNMNNGIASLVIALKRARRVRETPEPDGGS